MNIKTKWKLINKQIFGLISEEELEQLKVLSISFKPSKKNKIILTNDDTLIRTKQNGNFLINR